MANELYESVRKSTRELHASARRLGRAQDELKDAESDFSARKDAYEKAMSEASGKAIGQQQ